MGTLLKAKTAIRLDRDLRHKLVRGSRHEILLDLDGDKLADIALIDDNHDGDLDTIAVDLSGNGEFDLFLIDTDHNNIPDKVLYDEAGDGELRELAAGPEVEEHLISAAQHIYMLMMAEEIIAERVDEALAEMDRKVRDARKELKKRK